VDSIAKGGSLQNIPVDLQSLKLINFRLLLRSAQQHLFNVLGALASMFKTSSQLRLENLALRQQLAVLRRSPGTSHYHLMRAFVDDATLCGLDRELNLHDYRTHEFGDSIFIERKGRGAESLEKQFSAA
jgi:hypothetical protein